MHRSRMAARASLAALALSLVQGCTTTRHNAAERSLTEAVAESFYTKRMYITGSRIARRVDLRKPIEVQGSQTMKIVKVE